MAEALKDSFGTDVPGRIATMIEEVHASFPARAFVADALDGFESLGLTARARHIAAALARHLPPDPEEAIPILVDSLRTLVKQGHTGALGLLGFRPGSPVACDAVRVTPGRPRIGGRVLMEATLSHATDALQRVLVDLRIHFVKANGTTRPKVFKGAELHLPPGEPGIVRKTISLAQHTTRTHYPGRHRVEVLVNGDVAGSSWFEVRSPSSAPS